VLLAVLVVLAAVPQVWAASFALTDQQVQQAIQIGERSITEESLGDEWRVQQGNGPVVTVMTPFHRVALAARHAAFRNEVLTPRERQRLLRAQKDRIVFWVELKGVREDFARFFTPRLVVAGRELEASFTQNERTAARADDGGYLARCVYGFPTKHVAPTGRVTLLVRDGEGRDITSVPIDLSTMR
jgi:hypothetical protein